MNNEIQITAGRPGDIIEDKIVMLAESLRSNNEILAHNNDVCIEILRIIDEERRARISADIESAARLDVISQEIIALQAKTNHVIKPKDGFMTQSALGASFNPSIGPKYMGKLLRIVGIAKMYEGKTIPYRQTLEAGFAESKALDSYTVYYWNHDKCLKRIDSFMLENGLMSEFTAIKTEKEMKLFINRLYGGDEA